MTDNRLRAAEVAQHLGPIVDFYKVEVIEAALDAAEARGRGDVAARIARHFDEIASPTLHGDPFILASEWAAQIVRALDTEAAS